MFYAPDLDASPNQCCGLCTKAAERVLGIFHWSFVLLVAQEVLLHSGQQFASPDGGSDVLVLTVSDHYQQGTTARHTLGTDPVESNDRVALQGIHKW